MLELSGGCWTMGRWHLVTSEEYVLKASLWKD